MGYKIHFSTAEFLYPCHKTCDFLLPICYDAYTSVFQHLSKAEVFTDLRFSSHEANLVLNIILHCFQINITRENKDS